MIEWIALAAAMQAAPAQALVKVAPPAAVVRGNTVTHSGAHVTVRVPKSATYVGSDRFDLYGVADAEIQVFADRDKNQRLTKLYWIQFESYWPSQPDKTYNYTSDRREQHWGNTVWVRSGPTPTTAPGRPGSDREHVEAILKRAGYNPPPEVMNVRMVQLLDDPQGSGHGRQELMFIYSEDLAQSGKTLDDLTTDGKPNASWAPIEKGLVERAVTAFSVEWK